MIHRLLFKQKTTRNLVQIAGQDTIDILKIISPLRYDVLIRKEMFEIIASSNDSVIANIELLLKHIERTYYRVWFDKIYLPKTNPDIKEGSRRADKLYRNRVIKNIQLFESIKHNGLIEREKIILRSGDIITETKSGKKVSATVFPGDGCHRMAALLALGITKLTPNQYLIEVKKTLTPIDNTSTLLEWINLGTEEYARFLSYRYGNKNYSTLNDLLNDVNTENKVAAEELALIIEKDNYS